MRILQIGNFDPPHSTENHLREAMEALGHQVALVQEDNVERWVKATSAISIGSPERLPEVVIWTRTKSLTERVPLDVRFGLCRELADAGIPLFGVHLDRWWGLARESDLTSGDPYFSDLMTILWTADGGHDDKWEEIGVNHRWFQPAVSHVEANRYGEYREELCSPIAFVGSWQDYHPEWARRRELIEWLQRKYRDRVRLWPKLGQPGIRGQELCDLYESSCIVVGDSCLVPRRDGTSVKRYISDRVPETIGRGGFLIHPRVEGVTDGTSYTEGEHLACYDTLDELDEKIRYYISHDDERLAMAIRGQEHVRANHLYIHRMKEVLSYV